MNKFGLGDLVVCKIRPYKPMIIVNKLPQGDEFKYVCRWFNEAGSHYVLDEFWGFELEGVKENGKS